MNPDEKQVLPESEWQRCPDCPDQGYYGVMSKDGKEAEQVQCEWCNTNPASPYYQTKILPALLETELARLTRENGELREAVEYALGCIDGKIRDYGDELPKKLRAALG